MLSLDEHDCARLRAFQAIVDPQLEAVAEQVSTSIADHFADTPLRRERALFRDALALRQWMTELLAGPHDTGYYDRHRRLGGSPIRSDEGSEIVAVIAMVRQPLVHLARRRCSPDAVEDTVDSLIKILDLELMILLAEVPLQQGREKPDPTSGEPSSQLRLAISAIAHLLRNPLSNLSGAVQVLTRMFPFEEMHHDLPGKLMDQVHRLDRVVRELERFVDPVMPSLTAVDLRKAVLSAGGVAGGGSRPSVTVVGRGRAMADLALLQETIDALIQNATEAGASRLELAISDGMLGVFDDGPGISPEQEETIFGPFFTTGLHGLGLGLPNARLRINAMGGSLTVCSSPLGGAGFLIALPTVTRPPEASPADT